MFRPTSSLTLPPKDVQRWPGLVCDFLGTKVCYRARDSLTISRIRYIFSRFVATADNCDIEIALLTSDKPFVQAILTPDQDAVQRSPEFVKW